MYLELNQNAINVFKALSNESRIKIIELLSKSPQNLASLSEKLNLSPSIITRHIQQLEKSNIIRTELKKETAGNQKICYLNIDEIIVTFPHQIHQAYQKYTIDIPLGSYTQFDVEPTCGLASETNYIGTIDDPKYFMDPHRLEAQLVWFANGFVEYSFLNPLSESYHIHLIEISFEIASEFPENNYVWPSDINFWFNGSSIGTWTCPGNFADVRGLYTPDWWPSTNSQYGLLKHLRITPVETQIDGEKISNYKLANVNLNSNYFTFRFLNSKQSNNVGGITLFGDKFGNHPQGLRVTFYYTNGLI